MTRKKNFDSKKLDEEENNMLGISLFSSGGIGDLALKKAGVEVILANELIEERVSVFKKNYPNCFVVNDDIWKAKDEIIKVTKNLLNGKKLDFILATPPCQGMSKNGRGKLLNSIRKGEKGKFDKRNQLVIPVIDIALSLRPEVLIMENVPEMKNTLIPVNNDVMTILEYIKMKLEPMYSGYYEVIEFADYGVPQRRKRLITVFTKNKNLNKYLKINNTIFPIPTHSQFFSEGKNQWITLQKTLAGIPKLDAKNKELSQHKTLKYHRVPILKDDKYFWVKNTPLNKSAFDNQCINKECGFLENPTHKSIKNKLGINKSSMETPIFCKKCNSLLPRPWVKESDSYRIMKGFTSAYKRMNLDLPSNTLTQNLSYACSDTKIHPTENRVLSLYEAMKIHTIDQFSYQWEREDKKKVSDKLIREIIGESVPPFGFYIIIDFIIRIMQDKKL